MKTFFHQRSTFFPRSPEQQPRAPDPYFVKFVFQLTVVVAFSVAHSGTSSPSRTARRSPPPPLAHRYPRWLRQRKAEQQGDRGSRRHVGHRFPLDGAGS